MAEGMQKSPEKKSEAPARNPSDAPKVLGRKPGKNEAPLTPEDQDHQKIQVLKQLLKANQAAKYVDPNSEEMIARRQKELASGKTREPKLTDMTRDIYEKAIYDQLAQKVEGQIKTIEGKKGLRDHIQQLQQMIDKTGDPATKSLLSLEQRCLQIQVEKECDEKTAFDALYKEGKVSMAELARFGDQTWGIINMAKNSSYAAVLQEHMSSRRTSTMSSAAAQRVEYKQPSLNRAESLKQEGKQIEAKLNQLGISSLDLRAYKSGAAYAEAAGNEAFTGIKNSKNLSPEQKQLVVRYIEIWSALEGIKRGEEN